MLAKLLLVTLGISFALCQDCIPDQTNFYWQSPCQGQKFTNVVVPTNVQCYQNNITLDALGGIDCTQDLVCVVTITDNYGKTVANPKVDIALQDYDKSLGKCKWESVFTGPVLNNLDTCDFVSNCHFDSPPNPTQFVVDVNIYALAGSFAGILKDNTYYGISLTFKDDKTDLACAYIQDKLIRICPNDKC